MRAKRIGLSKVHGPVNPSDLMTKHVDHATQVRLLALMSVEARLDRGETAPETGEVDEQVCSAESATEEQNEPECEIDNSDEDAFDWIRECMEVWGDEVITGPLPLWGRSVLIATGSGPTATRWAIVQPTNVTTTKMGPSATGIH